MLVALKVENQGMISLAGKSYTNIEDARLPGYTLFLLKS